MINLFFISLLIFTASSVYLFKKYYLPKLETFSTFIYFAYNISKINPLNLDIYLTNNPLFQNRIQFIKFAREDFNYLYRSSSNSIVITTYERPECFRKVFEKIITYRPPDTEIIICDDASESEEKKQLLKEIADNYTMQNVYVIIHTQNFGSFHTKLDGFLFCSGNFIMSIDDDDDFNQNFYIELASNINKFNSSENKYDFIIPAVNDAFDWVHFPVTIKIMVETYHNHVSFAFRRSLMKIVNYPDHNFRIYRDDAPLMIPLFIQSDDSKVYHYLNHNQYIIGGINCSTVHEERFFTKKNSRQFYFNGLIFIMKFTRKYGNFNYINSYKIAYPDRDIPYDYFKI